MATKQVTIKINSVDITDYCTLYEIEDVLSVTSDKLTLTLFKTYGGVDIPQDPTFGGTVEIWEGYVTPTDTKRFKGIITNFTETVSHYIVTIYSWEYKSVLTTVTKHYTSTGSTGGKVSEIFKDLCDICDLPYTSASIQDSGDTMLLTDFICKTTTAFEKMDALAQRINWQWYYRADTDLVYFEPKGYTSNSNVIYIGGSNTNVAQTPPKWETVGTVINEVYIKGAYTRVVEPTQFASGDGVTTEFYLDYIPDSLQVFVDGVEQTVGVSGVTTSTDCVLDASNQLVTFTTPPSLDTDNVEFVITRLIETPVTVSDEDSIAALGLVSSTVITLSDVTTVEDAELIGNQFINVHKEEFLTTTLIITPYIVEQLNLSVGQLIYVNDTIYERSGTYLITKIIRRYPETNIEITIGNQEYKEFDLNNNTQLRLKRLEEQFSSEDVILNILRKMSIPFTLTSSASITQEFVCDSFILDHPINGVLDGGAIFDIMATSSASWTGTSSVGTVTLTNTTDSSFYKVSPGSMKVEYTSSGDITLTSTQSFGDVSKYTGTSSDMPTQGTVGVWLYTPSASNIGTMNLQIGSDDSNYLAIDATTYSSSLVKGEETEVYLDGWNYVTFKMLTGTLTGTPDWTSVAYSNIALTTSGGSELYLNYHTIGKSNYIALNGLGQRFITNTTSTS